ncbi:MAG: helix-turn-helix transcriptional regulator [Solobacterium sp.]|nr:helix-turn-helix transcriptional regulator [Solobacterium sp.]
MFKKTSSVEYLKYGEVYTDNDVLNDPSRIKYFLPVRTQALIYMYEADEDIYLRCQEGFCLLVISGELDKKSFQSFVIHRVIKIRKGLYFNFISLSTRAVLEMSFTENAHIQNRFFNEEYRYQHILPRLHIRELVAYYYNVRGANYSFPGERQQFWEFTYVDSGVFYTEVDGVKYTLKGNQCIFYVPGQFHKQHTENESCSYMTAIIDMEASEEYISNLKNRVFTADRETKKAIDSFVASDSKQSVYDKEMMILSLERTILNILKGTEHITNKVASTPMQQKFENELLEEIVLYINENIYSDFNVEELCKKFTLSRSSLQALFRNNIGVAPKEYISNLKLKKSKALIRESKYTISQIAQMLGFSSIHYFSRKFKQKFGINPTEYANTIL